MISLVRTFLFAGCIAASALCACGRSIADSIAARLDSLRSDPLEGLWRIGAGDDEVLFAIAPAPGRENVFDILLLESPDWRMPEGTVCGHASASGKPGVYDCRMLASPLDRDPARIRHFTSALELSDEGRRLVFRPYSSSPRISLRRWIPYFFRVGVIEKDTRPNDLLGAVRIYPPAPGSRNVNL